MWTTSRSLQRIPALRSIPDFVFRLSRLQRVVLSGNPQLQLNVTNQVSLSINELYVRSLQHKLEIGSAIGQIQRLTVTL